MKGTDSRPWRLGGEGNKGSGEGLRGLPWQHPTPRGPLPGSPGHLFSVDRDQETVNSIVLHLCTHPSIASLLSRWGPLHLWRPHVTEAWGIPPDSLDSAVVGNLGRVLVPAP